MLTNAELNELRDFVSEADENGSKYPGMSYEDGIRDMIAAIENEISIEEIING